MMICSACGTQRSARDRFCRHRDIRLKSNRAPIIFYRMLALFAGVLGVVTFVIAIRSNQPSKYPIGVARLLLGLVIASFVTWIRRALQRSREARAGDEWKSARVKINLAANLVASRTVASSE